MPNDATASVVPDAPGDIPSDTVAVDDAGHILLRCRPLLANWRLCGRRI